MMSCPVAGFGAGGLGWHTAMLEALERGDTKAVLPIFEKAGSALTAAAVALRDKQ
jgi:hypothetical protein